MRKGLLVIVQDKPTQFDAPLYARWASEANFNLRVFYTNADAVSENDIDPEIGRAPQWDHLNGNTVDVSWVRGLGALAVAGEIKKLSPKLVILCGYFPLRHLQLALLLKLAGVRIGLRSDNTLRHSRFVGIKGMVKRLVLPPILRWFDSWHPVGSLAQQYLETISCRTRPVYLFPYAADNDWFAHESAKVRAERDLAREVMGFSPGDFVVIGVMKWHDREDPLTLVESFRILHGEHLEARLLLVGDGPLRDEVRQRLLGFESAVHLPGYVSYSALPGLYAVSDVFVHTAPGEPWGVSVNEAMACGLPVIVAEGVGAGADLVEEGETGFVFADRDAQALANILGKMLSDRLLAQQLGRQAVAQVDLWSYGTTTQAMQEALDRVEKG